MAGDVLLPIDPTEALKNSPLFRWQLVQHEHSMQAYEAKVMQTLQCTAEMIDKGKAHLDSFKNFLASFADLNKTCFSGDQTLLSSAEATMTILNEVVKYEKVFIEQVYWSLKNLSEIRRRDLCKLHEMKGNFQRVNRTLEDALAKNAHSSKSKDHDGADGKNELSATVTCFAHMTLDYIFQINLVQESKKHEILEAFLSFVYATETFFHQGHDLFQGDWLNVKADLIRQLRSLKESSRHLERKMQDRHTLVPKEVFMHPGGLSVDPDVIMEGYLFKRSSRAIKTWNRRWFIIKNNKLLYIRPETDFSHQSFPLDIACCCIVMEDDLRLCLVRPAPSNCDRRFCFEVVTPNKSHMLQADSESLRLAWIKALKRTIEAAHHESLPDVSFNGSVCSVRTLPKASSTNVLTVSDEVCSSPGNAVCCECGSTDPKWASVNLGITLCIECCGIHRSLGVQVSKVRSITLDVWEPEQVRLLQLLGNKNVNDTFTASPYDLQLLRPSSPRFAREVYIKAKYLKRRFMRAFTFRNRRFRRHTINCMGNRPGTMFTCTRFASRYEQRRGSFPSLLSCACDASVKNGAECCINVAGYCSSRRSLSKSEPTLNTLNTDYCSGPCGAICARQDQVARQSAMLISTAAEDDVAGMLKAIANGAVVNHRSRARNGRTALHEVKSSTACELLLLNGAEINAQDWSGKTPLHHACQTGNTALVCFLIKRGADQSVTDGTGKTALDIAVGQANADIVTLLRLAKLSDEFKGDTGSANELAFLDACRDFTLSSGPNLAKHS